MSHGKEDLGMIASGPFEDILAAYQGPIENLIGESDSELVGALLPYVWLGRVPSRTREYIIEFAEKRGYPFPGSG